MESHADFATGRLNCASSKEKYKSMWSDLTTKLNALGLGEKSVEKWQKTLSDYKYSLKKRASEIKKSHREMGGGPECDKKLSTFDERILHILGNTFYMGCSVQELGLPGPSTSEAAVMLPDVSSQKRASEHDYALDTTPLKRKKQKESKTDELYLETINVLKEINTNVQEGLSKLNTQIHGNNKGRDGINE